MSTYLKFWIYNLPTSLLTISILHHTQGETLEMKNFSMWYFSFGYEDNYCFLLLLPKKRKTVIKKTEFLKQQTVIFDEIVILKTRH